MIITIARQSGCDADKVGQLLAHHYGVPLYTRKDFLDKAQQKGIYDEMYDFFSEHPIDTLAMAATIQEMATQGVRQKLREAVRFFVGREDCIIVGRCGNVILDYRPDLTTVFLHAPRQERINLVAQRDGLSTREAEERVDHIDEERRAYHRYYTGHVWGDAADYDLALDVHRYGTEITARIIEEAVEAGEKN